MGCHTHIYKNIKAYSKAELDEIIHKGIANTKEKGWFTSTREEYAQEQYEFAQEQIPYYADRLAHSDEYKMDDADIAYCKQMKLFYESADLEWYRNDYDDALRRNQELIAKAEQFLTLDHVDDESLKSFIYYLKPDLEEKEDGELYRQIYFDTIFRVHGYPQETFTDVEELISWLYTYNQDLIVEYHRQFDEYGNLIRVTETKGMSPTLGDTLRMLWKENRGMLYADFG